MRHKQDKNTPKVSSLWYPVSYMYTYICDVYIFIMLFFLYYWNFNWLYLNKNRSYNYTFLFCKKHTKKFVLSKNKINK